jgi:hypothetical protein
MQGDCDWLPTRNARYAAELFCKQMPRGHPWHAAKLHPEQVSAEYDGNAAQLQALSEGHACRQQGLYPGHVPQGSGRNAAQMQGNASLIGN